MEDIFIDNEYTKSYFDLIEYRKQNPLEKKRNVERHHIIPKSLGGSNEKDNLVYLTKEEHTEAHFYLVRMCKHENHHESMVRAAHFKINTSNEKQKRYIVDNLSEEYHYIKSEYSRLMKGIMSGKQLRLGKTFSEESRKKMSESSKGIEPWNKGKTLSEEYRKKLSEASKENANTLRVCNVCGITAKSITINRFHNNNCKSVKPINSIEEYMT